MRRANPVTSCWSAKLRIRRSNIRRHRRFFALCLSDRPFLNQRWIRSGRKAFSSLIAASRIAATIEAAVVIKAARLRDRTI